MNAALRTNKARRIITPVRAAAVCGVRPETLMNWAVEGRGPTPYSFGPDGHATAWTVDGLAAWRVRRNKAAADQP